jgi:hypothetical protein
MKKLSAVILVMALQTCVWAQKVELKTIPYDTLVVHVDSTGKTKLDQKNCPAVYDNLNPADQLYLACRGYIYRGKPIKAGKSSALKQMFVELSPVTFAAKDALTAADGSTDKLLSFLEEYPMLANGEFYFDFYKAMEKRARKNSSLKFKNILGDIAFKDEEHGVCAVTSVNFDAGPRQSPMSPAAGEAAVRNSLNIYFFDSNGKLKYQLERNCGKYISFAAVFDEKEKVLKVSEEYVTLYLNNRQGDIHVKLEYTVAIPALKFNFDKITYYTEIEGKPYMPVDYTVKSGADNVKNNK